MAVERVESTMMLVVVVEPYGCGGMNVLINIVVVVPSNKGNSNRLHQKIMIITAFIVFFSSKLEWNWIKVVMMGTLFIKTHGGSRE